MTKNLSPEEYLTDCLLCDGLEFRSPKEIKLADATKYISSNLIEDILDYSIGK